jgi:branched-chain amino acid transport system ATP-binding protein
VVRSVLNALAQLRTSGITILLADQNAVSALRMADRAYVLDTGRVVASGTSGALDDDERLRAAYLGVGIVAAEPA